MIKNKLVAITLFSILFATAGYAKHYYYVTNDYQSPDGSAPAIASVPDPCYPKDGFIEYQQTQKFTCDKKLKGDEAFMFEAATTWFPFFQVIPCGVNDFDYKGNIGTTSLVVGCHAFPPRK